MVELWLKVTQTGYLALKACSNIVCDSTHKRFFVCTAQQYASLTLVTAICSFAS